ncbi:DUF4188 domain-containing protein [Streptomyces sp. NBC_01525]|uniref:DUF4188 domain-containing protein n=1 Tax=Streptomyces benahoarensis TaxID=2595054 RepID=A0A553ZQ37_9ACTN|nr:DUF4188 domain-containing protein [Streptomyces benahoarensis]TSB31613.1 DUF4188 domain-containing protein [Streptomyces benahoarensis]TSB43577.1 DUF4188 domain-containing protein [Streptomyces benahoarensis]
MHPGRVTADADGDVVIFLIGMRIHHLWAVHRWLPVFLAMPRMLKELGRDRTAGLLHHRLVGGPPRTFEVVQYWESKEKLLAYAVAPDREHRPAWATFNRRARQGAGHVGIWHETYVVPAGSYETIYGDMPARGLGAAYGVRSLRDRVQAPERLGV